MASPTPQIIVYFWPGSPWAGKVTTYLALRGIPYTACHQPVTMPRPDLAAIGVSYRRIPVVAIGKDIYCDTLLIIQKLEALIPGSNLGAQTGVGKLLERLLEKWTDVVVFPRAAADSIPVDLPLVTDEKFIRDRSALWGADWSVEGRKRKRPDALANMRDCFELLEKTVLSDGREWLLGGRKPGMANLHAAWIFDWMLQLPNAFPEDLISKAIYPKTYAWCDRYNKAVAAASTDSPTIGGAEAAKKIGAASFFEPETSGVGGNEPLDLKAGDEVDVAPIDTGSDVKERGQLLTLGPEEIVVGVKTRDGVDVRIHTPRWNFSIRKA